MNPSIIQSYPHVNEYRRSSISSQENKRQLQVSPISDSYCSCCCSSFEEEEEQKSSSTICTTPIDTTPVQENNDEKTRGKKVHAIEELLQTERDYVQDLSHLVEICLKVLSQQTWIPLHHKKIIIRNAHDILQFHKQFIITFDTASLWNNWTCIAQTFLDQMESFKLYTNYCDRHAEAWSLCSKYREKPEWTGFLKECAIMDSNSIPLTLSNDIYLHYRQQSTKRLQFEDYLIKPVQRICRYQLLIKEIIRYSSTQTSEYELWNSVLDEMQEIVSDIDRLKHERDMKECTDRFIERIESDWRITKSQLQKLDHVLIAGAIEVTYSALGSSVSKPRYLGCFVFSSYLIMVRPKKHTSYEPKHWFPLRLAEFEDLNDIQGQREYSFIVKCRKHTFIFTATCGQEKQLWASKLQKAISEAKAKPRDSKFSAEDFIVSSLSGIGCKKIAAHTNIASSSSYIGSNNNNYHGDIRPSKSFSSENSSNDNIKKTKPVSSSLPPDIRLRRSMSTHIQFEDAIKTTISLTPSPPPLPPLYCLSNKRYSADYTNIKRSKSQHNQHNSDLFIRNNSSSSNNNDSFSSIYGLVKRRPSSVDLLSTTTTSSNRISRMSLQFKNSQMNAMKITVDHKLRDVCTQDYLSLRAWYMREKDQIAYYQTATNNAATVSPVYEVNSSNATNYYNHNHNQHNHHHHTQNNNSSNSNSNNNSGSSSSSSSNSSGSGSISNSSSRKLSASFIRSSASSLSLMIPKRTADVKIRHCDITGSCSSSLDRLTEPSTTNYNYFDKKLTTTITTNPNTSTSTSTTIDTITATKILFETTLTTKEESEDTKVQVVHPLQSPSSKRQEQLPKPPPPPPPPPPPSFFISQVRQEKFLERKKSSGRIMANKVLQRMKSFRCNNNGSNKKTIHEDTNKIEIQENEKIERDNHDINNENVTAVPFIKVGNTGHNDEPSKVAHELDNCDRQIFKGEEEEEETEVKERQQEPVKMGAFVYASTPVELPKKRNIWKSKLRILHESFLKNDVNNNKPSTFV